MTTTKDDAEPGHTAGVLQRVSVAFAEALGHGRIAQNAAAGVTHTVRESSKENDIAITVFLRQNKTALNKILKVHRWTGQTKNKIKGSSIKTATSYVIRE